ncbi:hypothetical protein Lepto7376_3695 [[Leptolyngbya] sp. PCC 7376]|uniref:hypothetical protein n=1 Tax=[Leptolyngbya] sp. PCC 7376 TaxID=111781 RepID=UPI00029F15F0|nr:hypothetical protein [[Leptolyngbya] sp. PCC 7376]AFY39871.1 hypothetical protein Lepto7376_3695 [[Leptolyngbya] sp. PCC 7376]
MTDFEALTMVAQIKDGGVSIHTDHDQIRELGMTKTLMAYASIKAHCESVIEAVAKDLGQDVIKDVRAVMEGEGDG